MLPFRPLPDDPGPAPQTWADDGGRRRVSLRRVLALVLLVLAVLAALGALMWGAAVDMDALRRSYTYRGVNRDSRGVTDSLPLPEDWIAAAPMGRRLALASGLGLQLLDEDGSELASCVATLASPALRVEKKAALAYDVGKATICVIDSALRSQVIDAGAGGGRVRRRRDLLSDQRGGGQDRADGAFVPDERGVHLAFQVALPHDGRAV